MYRALSRQAFSKPIDITSLSASYLCVCHTQRHVLEPTYPGITGNYLNLGSFYDAESLRPKAAAAKENVRAYQTLYARAYACIAAANGVAGQLTEHIIDDTIRAIVQKRTRGIIAREIGNSKKNGGTGRVTKRFLSALTYQGYQTRYDTAESHAERIYHLDNTMGLAHDMLTGITAAAVEAGYDCITCPAPLNPERLEHLIIPALSLAFVSSTQLASYEKPSYRHIRLDAIADGENLRAQKQKIRFSKKIFNLLISEAVTILGDAKTLHDELEEMYNPHVDFDGVYALAEEHLQKLLAES